MKKLFVLALPILLLGSCASVESDSRPVINEDEEADVYTYTDPDTGIQYLLYNTYKGGGITVRVDVDGKPYLGGK